MTALLIVAVGVAVVAALTATLLALKVLPSRGANDYARAIVAEASERRLSMLEVVGDGIIVVDPDLWVTLINEEAERLLRIGSGEAVGRRLDSIVDELASELVPEIEQARRTGTPITRTQASPSHGRWVEIRIQPALHETFISLRDVSERTRAELRLRDNERRLQLVTQNVDAVLWTADREGRFTTISGGAIRALKLDRDELIGRSAETLLGDGVLGDVFEGMPARVENVRDTGWLRHHVEPVRDGDGRVVGAVGVSIDVTELKVAHEMLYDAAHRDSLTGLPNRLALEARMAETITAAQDENRPFAVLFVDVDRFKMINDTLGHSVGDDVLREVGERLETAIRGGDMIARPGGDEFIVLLPRVRDVSEIQRVSERLLRSLAEPVSIAGRKLYVTASIGAAVYPDDGESAEKLIAHADAAMYRAKNRGRNRFAMFESSLDGVGVDRLSLEHELREAIDRKELELRFQPIVSMPTGEIVGCEALVRWQHPTRGLLNPDSFIGIAEETGAIVQIDRWVLREACAAAQRLRRIVPEFRIAINASSRNLCEPGLAEAVAQALEEYELPPDGLTIEVTETVALDDSVLPVLTRLHAMGVGVAMDDFGIGYSSLAYLKRLPISVLKVDRSFVRGIVADAYDRAIVASIVAIARALDFRVVAEGLEDAEQVREIAALGCHEAQGFKFGQPLTMDAFERNLLAVDRREPINVGAGPSLRANWAPIPPLPHSIERGRRAS